MPRSASIPAIFFATLCLALTIYLFNVAEGPEHRNTLLGVIIAEGLAISWLIWTIAQVEETKQATPIPVPRSRPIETIPTGPVATPKDRQPYLHRPLQPTRPPSRSSNPLPPPPTVTRRSVNLPTLPDLPVPQPGRSSNRLPEPTSGPTPPRPPRPTFNLDDLLPAASPGPTPIIAPPPRPQPTPAPQGRPKRPRKYASFSEDSGDLPAKIALTELRLCCDILSLGYACAASDGPVSTDEEDHLQGWLWCVVENTLDQDAATMHQALSQASEQCKTRGKQKLEVVSTLADSIRSTGEKKLIQAAAELCGEIIAQDGRLEPGEFATLSAAYKGLGVRSTKASKIASTLLSSDAEVKKMLKELKITDATSAEAREVILSFAWSQENGRMYSVKDPAVKEKMRQRMALIQKIRDLYREMDDHGK